MMSDCYHEEIEMLDRALMTTLSDRQTLLVACRKVLERGDSVPQWVLDVLQAAVTKAVSG